MTDDKKRTKKADELAIEPNDLIPISKFAHFTSVSRPTLIYYDEIGIFNAAHRGEENGYRYYAPNQLIAINLINVMSDLQVPLKEMKRIANNRSPQNMKELLAEQSEILQEKIKWLTHAQRTTEVLTKLIDRGLAVKDADKISVIDREEKRLVLGPKNDFETTKSFYRSFLKFCLWARDNGYSLNYPIGGWWEDLDAFLAAPSDPQHFFLADPKGRKKIPAGKCVTAHTHGFYGETNDAPDRLANFIKRKKLKTTGPVINIYLLDEITMRKPEDYLLEISVPIED
jgi:DNA-binding transcriptional MerR regulator